MQSGFQRGFLDLKDKQTFTVRGLLFSQWEQKRPEVGGPHGALGTQRRAVNREPGRRGVWKVLPSNR